MKKKYKMLLELVRKQETEMGAIPIMESIKLAKDFWSLAKKSGYDCYLKWYPKEILDYKPTWKNYKIETVEDIAKLTAEQFELFIEDLRQFCNFQREANILNQWLWFDMIQKKENWFIWQDTWLNEAKITAEISNKI